MSIIGPILAAHSERIGAFVLRTKPAKVTSRRGDLTRDELFALVEATSTGGELADTSKGSPAMPPAKPVDRADDEEARRKGDAESDG